MDEALINFLISKSIDKDAVTLFDTFEIFFRILPVYHANIEYFQFNTFVTWLLIVFQVGVCTCDTNVQFHVN